jgi:hypothetical protein
MPCWPGGNSGAQWQLKLGSFPLCSGERWCKTGTIMSVSAITFESAPCACDYQA